MKKNENKTVRHSYPLDIIYVSVGSYMIFFSIRQYQLSVRKYFRFSCHFCLFFFYLIFMFGRRKNRTLSEFFFLVGFEILYYPS